jgi:hypothetical protein
MAQRVNYKRDKRQRELKKQEKAQLKLQKRLARTQSAGGESQPGETPAETDGGHPAGADDGPANPPED